MTSTKFNIYQHVTDQIIACLAAGTAPWQKPWSGSSSTFMPLRATGEAYRGINIVMLWLAAAERNYTSPVWMTYPQSQKLGGQVRKGEKSTTVIKYGTFDDQDAGETASDEGKKRAYVKAYRVFNLDQIDGLPDDYHQRPEIKDHGTQADPVLEAWFRSMGVQIDTTDNPTAYYHPATDRIHMPPVQTFETAHGYFATLAHEMSHATMDKKRCNRVYTDGSAEARYAKEELCGEISSAMVCARLGVQPSFGQNAAYLNHWIGVLKEDNRVIFKAAADAQLAADWMFNKAGEPLLDRPITI